MLGAASCGSSGSSSTAGSAPAGGATVPHIKGGVVKIALNGSVDYIDPALDYYQSGWQIQYSTDVKLTNYKDLPGNAGRVIYPEAASALPTVSSDGLTYTYTVPSGRFKFNTGEPVTAKTFQYAIERDLNPKQSSFFGAFFLGPYIKGATGWNGKGHIAGVQVSGDKLIITLTKPDGALIPELTTPFADAIPLSTPIDSKGVNSIAAAGPYYISSFTPNKALVLKKNPNWTNAAWKRPAYASEIDYVNLTIDQNAGTLEARNGQLDYINDAIVPAEINQLNAQYGPKAPGGASPRFFLTPAATILYEAMNTARPAFKNQLVRQAVSWALDRPALSRVAGFGVEQPTDKYLPPQIAGSQDEKSIYPITSPTSADISKAKSLIAQSGVKTPIHAVLYTCNAAPCPDRAAILQQNLKQIGIDLTIKEFTRGVQFTKEGNKGEPFDIADEGWVADFYDAYDFMNVLLNGEHIPATGGNNFSYFNNATYNKLSDQANALTGAARDKAYGDLATQTAQTWAPWAGRAVASNYDFFSARIGCQVDQGSYGFALNSFCIKS